MPGDIFFSSAPRLSQSHPHPHPHPHSHTHTHSHGHSKKTMSKLSRKMVQIQNSPQLLMTYIGFTAFCVFLIYTVTSTRRSEQQLGHVPHLPFVQQRPPDAEGNYKERARREQLEGQQQYQNQHQIAADQQKHDSSLTQTPFSRYSCLGDDLHGEIYNAPFRFHVYNDMPDKLLDTVMERAEKYWQPHHSNNQFTTEIALVKDLPMHPCHTEDPNMADAFIVPVQTVSTIWLEKEDGRKDGGRTAFAQVMEWLTKKPTYKRTQGRDHYAMAIAWDTGRRPFGDINLLGPETPTNFQDMYSFDFDKYMHGLHDIVMPYPDSDSQEYYTEERLGRIKRDKLAVFVGSMVRTTPIRSVIYDQMLDYNRRKGDELAIWKYIAHQNGTDEVLDLLPTALFGPVMTGDSFSSRRLFSLIFAGTIPVIICDRLMLPYEDVLDYSSFAVFFSEQDIVNRPNVNVFDILKGIPQSEIRRLQKNGKKVRKHFMFHEGKPKPGDAFDMFVRQLAQVNFNNRRLKNMLRRATYKSID